MPNVAQVPVVYYGALRAAGVVVPMNPLLKAREAAYYLGDSGAGLMFAWHAFADEARGGAEEAGAEPIVVDGGSFPDLLASAAPDYQVVERDDEDAAVILYTSGTTGQPKGAELTHGNLISNTEVARTDIVGARPDDVIFGGLPLFRELARQAGDAGMISAATLGMSKIVAGYIDQTSEEMVAAYGQERENWLRNRSAARAARIRDLLSGERVNLSATEATLGYRLRQYHVGLVCWAGEATAGVDNITRLEHAISHVAGKAACSADPVFLPRDESSAWAWLPLGIRATFDGAGARTAGADGDVHFAFGDAPKGVTGFRLTHRQAVAAQAVALAAGSPPPRVVTFSEVAPVAMMLGSADLLRAWVLATLGGLATDDEHHARLRDTLLVFLQSGGSYKATAEQMVLHKNTVQCRIRKAEESLGRAAAGNHYGLELALQAGRWLGSAVLQPPRER